MNVPGSVTRPALRVWSTSGTSADDGLPRERDARVADAVAEREPRLEPLAASRRCDDRDHPTLRRGERHVAQHDPPGPHDVQTADDADDDPREPIVLAPRHRRSQSRSLRCTPATVEVGNLNGT